MRSRFLPFTILSCALAFAVGAAKEVEKPAIHGPDIHPGYPDFFNLNYMIGDESISPDGKYGVIHPTRSAGGDSETALPDFLVALRPFRILGIIASAEPYFQGESHGGLSVSWLPDSTVALVKMEGKWGPRAEQLIELADGRIARQTDLLAAVHRLLLPDFRKVKPEPYNDVVDFVIEGEEPFRLDKSGHVKISGTGTTNPKDMGGIKSWEASVDAVWDIAQAKFTRQKVARTFAGVHKEQ